MATCLGTATHISLFNFSQDGAPSSSILVRRSNSARVGAAMTRAAYSVCSASQVKTR